MPLYNPVSAGGGSGTLTTIEEADANPTDSAVTKLVFPNGTLGIAAHVATYTPAGGGGSGALVFLEAHTASSSATLDFTSAISSTYDDYLIEIVGIVPASNNVTMKMQLSSDGGSTWSSSNNYYSAIVYVLNSGSAAGSNFGGFNPGTYFVFGDALSNSSTRGVSGSLRLISPGSTTVGKPLIGSIFYTNQSNLVGGMLSNLLDVSGTAYNAFQFSMSSGNIASGVIRVYGISKT